MARRPYRKGMAFRLGYTWSDSCGCEPSNFDIVLDHVRDLSRIMAEYDNVVVGVEAGVAGPWAEGGFSSLQGGEKRRVMPHRPVRFANAGMWNDELKANSFGTLQIK